MEPIKKLRKHHVIEVKYDESLWDRFTRLSENFHRRRTSPASWVITSAEVANMINSMYETDEIEVSDFRIEDDSYVQDIFLKPKRTIKNIDLNITVQPISDTWQDF